MDKRNHITIRTADVADASALLNIYRPYVEKTAITFEYDVPSEEEFARRIAATMQRYPYLVAEIEGEVIGYAYAGPLKERAAYDWSVEVTVYISQTSRKQGIGRRLYEELEARLKEQGILNLYACIAYPVQDDPYLTMDSVHFHESLGYEQIARFHQCGYKFGRWYDMIWMEKMIGPHEELAES